MNQAELEEDLDKLYPSSDGIEMGESTDHIDLMTFLYDNFRWHFQEQNVSVHADLFWYPVKGFPKIRRAPDLMVILDCEPNKRKSYRQWLEGDKPATMVIEVLSESNDEREMRKRRAWYRKYGVSEYYEIEEETNAVSVWLLQNGKFVLQTKIRAFTSPATGMTFDWSGEGLVVSFPDGTPFRNSHEIRYEIKEAFRQQQQAEAEKEREAKLRQELEARNAELQKRIEELEAKNSQKD